MEKNNVDEYASVNHDYEKLIEYPFLYEVIIRTMSCEEILNFYMYVLSKYAACSRKDEYKTILEDLEKFEVVQLFISGNLTLEELKRVEKERKDIIDDNSSVKDYFEELLSNFSRCYSKIDEMEDIELVQFYRYVISILDHSKNVKDEYWKVASYLEEMPIIQAYNDYRLDIKDNGISYREKSLTEEERQQIDETVLLLEKRRKISPFKKLMKVIKG